MINSFAFVSKRILAELRAIAFVVFFIAAFLFRVPIVWSAPEISTNQDNYASVATYREVESDIDFAASHAAVLWKGAEDARISVFWKNSDGSWSYPVIASFDEDSTSQTSDGFNRSSVIVVGESRRVRISSDTDLDALKIMTIDTVHGARHLEERVSTSSASASSGLAGPSVITRAGWGADESIRRGTPEYSPVVRFVIHHTDTANSDPNPAATVRAIFVFHVQGNGWNDIGYNYLVDSSGRVYEGRYSRDYAPGETPTADNIAGDGVIGAHASGYNTGSIGIAVLGNFTSTAPANSVLSAIERTMAWQADRHEIGISSSNVHGHRDVGSTSCPGQLLYNKVPEIANEASRLLGFSGSPQGYWITEAGGKVNSFGNVGNYGDMSGSPLNAPIVGMAPTPTGLGYWLLGADGGIFAFGDAHFYGSTGAMRLNKPVVGFEPTPSGEGYWLVASDGGIFAFGDARFYGSTGAMRLNAPVVGMTSTPSGGGYWLVASDGGIFTFGDSQFYGSTGAMRLNAPIVGMAKQENGSGYWLVASDGGIFSFNVPFYGSVPGLGLNSFAGATHFARSFAGDGYYVLGKDGGVFTFGDAQFFASIPGTKAVQLTVAPGP